MSISNKRNPLEGRSPITLALISYLHKADLSQVSIEDFSSKCGKPVGHVINQLSLDNTNFTNIYNAERNRRFKRLWGDGERDTRTIAKSLGFNTHLSFYQWFKANYKIGWKSHLRWAKYNDIISRRIRPAGGGDSNTRS